jgi:hypothetical protein
VARDAWQFWNGFDHYFTLIALPWEIPDGEN